MNVDTCFYMAIFKYKHMYIYIYYIYKSSVGVWKWVQYICNTIPLNIRCRVYMCTVDLYVSTFAYSVSMWTYLNKQMFRLYMFMHRNICLVNSCLYASILCFSHTVTTHQHLNKSIYKQYVLYTQIQNHVCACGYSEPLESLLAADMNRFVFSGIFRILGTT